jgi:hypothetical protein
MLLVYSPDDVEVYRLHRTTSDVKQGARYICGSPRLLCSLGAKVASQD